VSEGDGVMLRGRNQPQVLLAWLALLQCGARVLPVNPQLPALLLEALLPTLTLRFAVNLADSNTFVGLTPLELRPVAQSYAIDWQPQRLASMTLTSGSTGLPKAAVHTCAAHLASAQGVLAMIPFAPEDDWLLSLPLYHVSGQGILWRWLLAGARLTVSENGLAEALQGVPMRRWCQRNCGAC
jgi:O-succinylbenzoic acid--CoA ligase